MTHTSMSLRGLKEWEHSTNAVLLLCRRMLVKQQDAASVTKFQAKLQGHAKKMGGTFVHYSAQDGVWILKVEHF